ncbi:hypothetical protein [Glycomyces algeriensis]|jgi:hypothetical protein|uniref:Uncharacterized protein n=1 Tax=Glycomyces algeriensis TaxID=256037 RepID=A0A9W6G6M2_9ACTN|nr:hypothetical protein [Glycomyces algeriensis]MDA1367064.1 hypothetical protein [Glycomyces algeriensis]MDR7348549.1 hypothetical protein [Glycomyces algeriensis]GLI41253.1 hypothetical protein GALLR39Z86_11030 [Glycomyces algeriensis]
MSIHINDQGILEIPDEYDDTLGTFLFLEIGYDPYKCLVALFHVAQIVQRRSTRQAVGGDSVSVEVTPEIAAMQDHFAPSRSKNIPFEDFKAAVEELWVVIYRANSEDRPSRVFRPDLSPAQGDLVLWEQTFKQRHPYRGQIEGIPAHGPD